MKTKELYLKATKHFDDLKTNLENQDKKKHLEIIEYLINFLGCLTLSMLLKTIKAKKISKGINISDLSAHKWQCYIEKWIGEYSANENIRGIETIKSEFMQEGDDFKLHDYIDQWRHLRNDIEHDMPLINETQLTDYLNNNLFPLQANLDSFVQSVLRIIKKHPNTLKSDLFYWQNDTIYIYSSIEADGDIKYIHFNLDPLKFRRDNFPLSYDVISLSLSPTAKYLLAEEDVIQVTMTTTNPMKSYENDFELWINDQLVKTLHNQSYKNGGYISFPLTDINFQDGQEINVKVRALWYGKKQGTVSKKVRTLRDGKEQSTDSKMIEIYSKVPDITILETQVKHIPTGKNTTISLFLHSVFEVQDIEIESLEPSSKYINIYPEKPLINKVQDTLYRTYFDVMSTLIGEASLDVSISYIDRKGVSKTKNTQIHIVFTPNYFEPDFEGEERKKIISDMLSKRTNYLITGEGGVGKSRLIDEYFYKKRAKPSYEIKIQPLEGLAVQFANQVGISTEKDKREVIYQKIIKWLREKAMAGKAMDFWISDCHEITNNKDFLFLRSIAQICSDGGNNIMLILESKDESCGDSAKKLIEELDVPYIHSIRLKRLEEEEQMRIVDSVFKPNKFDMDFKSTLIKKSDGIIYCLLEYLKSLDGNNFFVFQEGQIWSHKPFIECKDLLKDLDCKIVRKTDVDNCLKELDLRDLGKKGRNVLRYLCFGSIHENILRDLLESDIQSFQYILEILGRAYIIKCTEEVYEFHHQLKKDYFYKRLFPSYMRPDYYADICLVHRVCGYNQDDNELYPFVGAFDAEEGEHLKDTYKKLNEPRLKSKVKWLLHCTIDDELRNAKVEILFQYANILTKEDILDALEDLFFDGYNIAIEGEMGTLHNINFHELRKKIEEIFKMKNMDDFEQYQNDDYKRIYCNINIRIEIEELLLTFHEKYNIIDFENYPRFDELSVPIFNLTDIFLNNRHFLLETYTILENIYFYFELAKEFDVSERLLRLHDHIDIYKSFVHLLALLILTEQEKNDEYSAKYLIFLNKLSWFMPQEMISNSETTEFAAFHKNFALKQYPEKAEIISDDSLSVP